MLTLYTYLITHFAHNSKFIIIEKLITINLIILLLINYLFLLLF